MSPLLKGRMAAVATLAGLALSAFCAWQLHLIIGQPHSRLHDLLMGGIALGCFIAFPAVLIEGVKAVAPLIRRNGGGS